MAVLSVGAALTAGGLLFAQPVSSGPRTRVVPPAAGFQAAGISLDAPAVPSSADSSSVHSLLLGVTLGLVVAFAGVGLPGAAQAAGAAAVPEDFDYRKTPDVKKARAWAAAKAKKWANRQFTPVQDKKYSETSTGAGRYKLYGLDFFSPIASIPSSTNGTYPVRAPAPKKNDRMIAAAQPFLNAPSKYGNYYSPSSPYSYSPK